MGAYNASKFALEGLSESLRRELMMFGIDVIIVAPGNVATPIWDKAEAVDDAQFGNSPYASVLARFKSYAIDAGRKGLPPEKIGQTVKTALTGARPSARYTVTHDPVANLMTTRLPKRVVDNLIARRLGFKS
jgi:NAD(P)-dependent dehydrogenase (short-subunit alcohol dehydrogenase family)